MIPPISPSVLVSNPKFAALHAHLTTTLLDPNTSTRALNTTFQPTTSRLQTYHVQVAKRHILLRALSSLAASELCNLPPDVQKLLDVTAVYLSAVPYLALRASDHDLLAPEISAFLTYLPLIVPLLSTKLQTTYAYMLSLLSSPSSSHPNTKSSHLPTLLRPLLNPTLPSPTSLLPSLATLSTHQLAHLTSLITTLESSTHGPPLRHLLAHSLHLSTVSAALASKSHLHALQFHRAIFSPEMRAALANYGRHLQMRAGDLEARVRELQRELALYESAGGEGLRECGRRYSRVEREIEAVGGEIRRLEEGPE